VSVLLFTAKHLHIEEDGHEERSTADEDAPFDIVAIAAGASAFLSKTGGWT
jgi:hypothetical protein